MLKQYLIDGNHYRQHFHQAIKLIDGYLEKHILLINLLTYLQKFQRTFVPYQHTLLYFFHQLFLMIKHLFFLL